MMSCFVSSQRGLIYLSLLKLILKYGCCSGERKLQNACYESKFFVKPICISHLAVQWCRRQGCKRTPKSFDLSKNWTKSLKIWAKMTPNVIWLQKMAPNVWRNTNEYLYFGGRTKNGLCGRKFVGKGRTTTFRASLRKFGQKSRHSPKNFLAPTPVVPNRATLKGSAFQTFLSYGTLIHSEFGCSSTHTC